MQRGLILAMLVVVTSAAVAQRLGPPPAYPPTSGTSTFSLHPMPGYLPTSLQVLCDRSTIIVDAQVQNTFQPRVLGSLLETDVVLLVTEVLKGPAASRAVRELVVAQRGGILGDYKEMPADYPLMQPGEHYILFLTDDTRPNLPDRGMLRQYITGGWVGMFRIDGDKVRLSNSALRQKYENMAVAQALTDIRACIQPATR